jgi:hypothetical protein
MKELQREADRVKNEARLAKLAQTKVTINLGPDEDRVTDEAVRALARHPDIYQRAGSLVNVRRDLSPHESDAREKDGRGSRCSPLPRCATTSPRAPCGSTPARTARTWCTSLSPTVNAVHARGEWRGIRTLHAVVETPMLRPDGTVLDTPGFDAATGLLYVPNGRFPKVPTHPTREQIDAAKALLFDVVADFPFKEQCHRSAWLSSLLTPLARFAFRGCSPINLIDGNTPGAGKGRLANTVGVVVLGRDIGVMAAGKDDEEQRKAITSKALTGARLVLIDNVDGALGGPALDAALTTTELGRPAARRKPDGQPAALHGVVRHREQHPAPRRPHPAGAPHPAGVARGPARGPCELATREPRGVRARAPGRARGGGAHHPPRVLRGGAARRRG